MLGWSPLQLCSQIGAQPEFGWSFTWKLERFWILLPVGKSEQPGEWKVFVLVRDEVMYAV